MELTQEQKLTNYETLLHIKNVAKYLHWFIKLLVDRAEYHDLSKTLPPELEIFTEFTPKLAKLTYGSDEYAKCLKDMNKALEHHYAVNRHHPEHFGCVYVYKKDEKEPIEDHTRSGINGMNLVDLIEMFCDWQAATLRHDDGDMTKSIEINAKRFNMDEQLVKIFKNTADVIWTAE